MHVSDRLQILAVNDDGIHAPGLKALVEALRELGDVEVVAPLVEQSGMSHRITYLHPIMVREIKDERGDRYGWAVDGSPADCVKLGILEFCPRPPDLIVSGIGEQPARTHMQQFGLSGFTSGCVCVAPKLSMEMLHAIKAGDNDSAEQIRRTFEPLEDLRNSINPVRVLHSAVALAGIADTGPILPLLSDLNEQDRERVKKAACELLAQQ